MYYILEGKKAVKCDSETFGKWLRTGNRRVAFTEISLTCSVSTVFLGLDHSFIDGPPMIFETMVFGEGIDEHVDEIMERYSTWEQAEAGHAKIVAEMRRKRFKVVNGRH